MHSRRGWKRTLLVKALFRRQSLPTPYSRQIIRLSHVAFKGWWSRVDSEGKERDSVFTSLLSFEFFPLLLILLLLLLSFAVETGKLSCKQARKGVECTDITSFPDTPFILYNNSILCLERELKSACECATPSEGGCFSKLPFDVKEPIGLEGKLKEHEQSLSSLHFTSSLDFVESSFFSNYVVVPTFFTVNPIGIRQPLRSSTQSISEAILNRPVTNYNRR